MKMAKGQVIYDQRYVLIVLQTWFQNIASEGFEIILHIHYALYTHTPTNKARLLYLFNVKAKCICNIPIKYLTNAIV